MDRVARERVGSVGRSGPGGARGRLGGAHRPRSVRRSRPCRPAAATETPRSRPPARRAPANPRSGSSSSHRARPSSSSTPSSSEPSSSVQHAQLQHAQLQLVELLQRRPSSSSSVLQHVVQLQLLVERAATSSSAPSSSAVVVERAALQLLERAGLVVHDGVPSVLVVAGAAGHHQGEHAGVVRQRHAVVQSWRTCSRGAAASRRSSRIDVVDLDGTERPHASTTMPPGTFRAVAGLDPRDVDAAPGGERDPAVPLLADHVGGQLVLGAVAVARRLRRW